jgi:hypothetical protein
MAGGDDDARRYEKSGAAGQPAVAEVALDLAHGRIGRSRRLQHARAPVRRAYDGIVGAIGEPIENQGWRLIERSHVTGPSAADLLLTAFTTVALGHHAAFRDGRAGPSRSTRA